MRLRFRRIQFSRSCLFHYFATLSAIIRRELGASTGTHAHLLIDGPIFAADFGMGARPVMAH